MKLTGKQLNLWCAVLCDAYTKSSLEQMVRFELDESLENIVANGSFRDVVFDLIRWSEQYGREEELLRAAYKYNNTHPALKKFAMQHLDDEVSAETPANKRLTEAQANLIQAFYADLRDIEQSLDDLYYLHRPIGIDPPQVDVVVVIQQMRDLQKSADKLTIYFSAELTQKIQQMCSALGDVTRSLERREQMLQLGATSSDDEVWNTYEYASNKLHGEVPWIRAELEAEFRQILGAG